MSLLRLNFEDLEKPKITAKDFEKFESDYKIYVPDDLKELFLKTNDCFLEYPIVKCSGINGGEVMPSRWVGIAPNGINYSAQQ